ncbi:MAG: PilW family protein [Salinisphaera sp.]|jgi:type IV pilus assembly protein PilW|nr:PilW family protein [Salinisphaera sp.]
MNARQKHTQRGFTLVELMVALVISLLLLAGILQILLGNRQSYSVQQSVAGLQENSRLVSFIVDNMVAHAGYRANLDATNKQLFLALGNAGDGLPIDVGAFVAGSNGGASGDDSVRIRFQAAGGVHDCAGTEIDGYQGGRSSTDKPLQANADFALLLDKSDPNDITLDCVIYNDDDQPTLGSSGGTPGIKNTVPLVDGVDRFKVRYGIDTNSDHSVDQYVSTLTATTATQVLSLRLQLLLHSDNNASPSPIAQTYTFLDGSSKTYTDRRARTLLDQTVALRNVLP